MKNIKYIFILGMVVCGGISAKPYGGILPASVNYENGNRFWCDAHLQMTRQCSALEVNSENFMVIVKSSPTKNCEGGHWGWVTGISSNAGQGEGATIVPDKGTNLTVKDLCRPGTQVTFLPNSKRPEYDDLVVKYQGREILRYKSYK